MKKLQSIKRERIDFAENLMLKKGLSVYIHIPWCLSKCPYCDFNSYKIPASFPESSYIKKLIDDLQCDLSHFSEKQEIESIYIGGGTPTLFKPESYDFLLQNINKKINFAKDIEISIEANPATFDLKKAEALFALGINRLSLGIQSFQDIKLQTIGRVHNASIAFQAIATAKKAGFHNINIDIMYGLPEQTLDDALFDLKTATSLEPNHISWYQLTLEKGTAFYNSKISLPCDDSIFAMQESGYDLLEKKGFSRYEISAYSDFKYRCRHNLNYWLFGDYLGLGAGAHGKFTINSCIFRTAKIKNPIAYLKAKNCELGIKRKVLADEITFEFMLNILRLCFPVKKEIFWERTGIDIASINSILSAAEKRGFLRCDQDYFITTTLGRNFLNELLEMFLPL